MEVSATDALFDIRDLLAEVVREMKRLSTELEAQNKIQCEGLEEKKAWHKYELARNRERAF